ncbi:MAG: carbohydrate kinase family protein [Actinomycetota bacterium]|nr:carbohydrate kinase family protein [Actinomycetota bacterium]
MNAPSICVIGNVNVDLIARSVTELPPPGEERPVERIEYRPGGAAANSTLALTALGSPARLVGCVGNDDLGRLLLESLRSAGVETGDVAVVREMATGVSVAFEAPERDRCFLISLGSLARFDFAMIPQDALRSKFVLVCGTFNLPLLRGQVRALLEEVRRRGGLTLFDPGWDPDGWTQHTRRELQELLPFVDVFLPNEGEARSLSKSKDVEAAADSLQRASGAWVVVKRSSQGCIAAGPGGARVVEQAPTVDVIDTTGAGDAFNAGLVLRLAEGVTMTEALPFAIGVASAVVSRPSSDRYPSRRDIAT